MDRDRPGSAIHPPTAATSNLQKTALQELKSASGGRLVFSPDHPWEMTSGEVAGGLGKLAGRIEIHEWAWMLCSQTRHILFAAPARRLRCGRGVCRLEKVFFEFR